MTSAEEFQLLKSPIIETSSALGARQRSARHAGPLVRSDGRPAFRTRDCACLQRAGISRIRSGSSAKRHLVPPQTGLTASSKNNNQNPAPCEPSDGSAGCGPGDSLETAPHNSAPRAIGTSHRLANHEPRKGYGHRVRAHLDPDRSSPSEGENSPDSRRRRSHWKDRRSSCCNRATKGYPWRGRARSDRCAAPDFPANSIDPSNEVLETPGGIEVAMFEFVLLRI